MGLSLLLINLKFNILSVLGCSGLGCQNAQTNVLIIYALWCRGWGKEK